MPDINKYDADLRPRSYFVTDAETAVLARIKGKLRREAARSWGPLEVDPSIRAESLTTEERIAAGRIHPALMGGEYLPDLGESEVEIARFELESTTSDVISLRAQQAEGIIRYRIVDEYETDYEISPRGSVEPLTFRELVEMINKIETYGLPRSLRELNYGAWAPDHNAAERLKSFVHVSSEYYPELSEYYEDEAAEWLEEKIAEMEDLERQAAERKAREAEERRVAEEQKLKALIEGIASHSADDEQLISVLELDGLQRLLTAARERKWTRSDLAALRERLKQKVLEGLIYGSLHPPRNQRSDIDQTVCRRRRIKQYRELTGDESLSQGAKFADVKAWLIENSYLEEKA